MLTLGYEPDTEISKADIARIQLIEAISLFLAGKCLCAITLAGAAEGVFAGLLNARQEKSVIEDSVQAIQSVRKVTGLAIMDDATNKEIFKQWNDVRNTIKHHDKSDGDFVTLNLFDEAYWMIRRAIENAGKCGVQIANKEDFENWIILNINL